MKQAETFFRAAVLHNFYQQKGGEDQVFAQEGALLRERGHHVIPVEFRNEDLQSSLQAAKSLLWNQQSYDSVYELIQRERIQILHCHNTLPLASPAVYYAARRAGARVVQTLHNYRMSCPGALCYRDHRVCVDCKGKTLAWPGIVHKCYRGSVAASAGVAVMTAAHRLAGTWSTQVDAYIALTGFAKKLLSDGGLPSERMFVNGNCVHPDPGVGEHRGRYVLYVGRLTEDKGIPVLLDLWGRRGCEVPLKIVGSGPLEQNVREVAGNSTFVEYLGPQPPPRIIELMKDARLLVFPSQWFEGFPMVLAEALATGLPVVASNLGGAAEIVENGVTGLLFEPGSADGLASSLASLYHDEERLRLMVCAARRCFEENHTADAHYDRLMEIYSHVLRAGGDSDRDSR